MDILYMVIKYTTMSQIKLFPTIFILIFSCTFDRQHNNTSLDESETIVSIDTVGIMIIEKNLKNQLNEYLIAFNGGDPDKAVSYCYPDMFVYLKQKYPVEYSMEAIKESCIREPVRNMKRMMEEKNVTYEFKIGEITKRIDLGTDKIYIVVTSLIAKRDLDEITMGDKIVAISNDNGQNWTFMQKNPESTPPVLKMKFSQEVVRQVMSE